MTRKNIGPSCLSPTRASGSIPRIRSACLCRTFHAKKQAPVWDWPSCIALSPITMDKFRPPIISRKAPFLHLNYQYEDVHRESLVVKRQNDPSRLTNKVNE